MNVYIINHNRAILYKTTGFTDPLKTMNNANLPKIQISWQAPRRLADSRVGDVPSHHEINSTGSPPVTTVLTGNQRMPERRR